MMRFVFFSLIFFGFTSTLFAEKISSYRIGINVKQSGELEIVEKIKYNFEGKKKHGIYRDIPLIAKINTLKRDIGIDNILVMMDNQHIKWNKSSFYSQNGLKLLRIKIGSPNILVSGEHTYSIAYKVKMGVFLADNKQDAIRWNIIGDGWKIPIENIEANFFFPDTLSENNTKVTYHFDTSEFRGKKSWINSKLLRITGSKLEPYHGADVEIVFDRGILDQNGYDNFSKNWMDYLVSYLYLVVSFGFLLFLFFTYKNSKSVSSDSITVMYLPPKDISLLQSGLIYNSDTNTKYFSAAILELAYLGYLRIKQKRKTSVLTRSDKKIENLTFDQKQILEKILFRDSNTFEMKKNKKKAIFLRNSFIKVHRALFKWVLEFGYFKKDKDQIKKNFLVRSIVLYIGTLITIGYTILSLVGPKLFFIMLILIVVASVALGLIYFLIKEKRSIPWIGLSGLLMVVLALSTFSDSENELILSAITPVSMYVFITIALYVTYKNIAIRTSKGEKIYQHLLGLKEYISRVKEDEIKKRLQLDPLYLERLLPYAILFDLNAHWLSFYEMLSEPIPDWYDGDMDSMPLFVQSIEATHAVDDNNSVSSSTYSSYDDSDSSSGGGGGGGSW